MRSFIPTLETRLESLTLRIAGLGRLKALVRPRPLADLTERQWQLAELTLERAHQHLETTRASLHNQLTPQLSLRRAQELHATLGELELQLSRVYNVFDTFMDVLTQRQGSTLGPWLKGCDVLADSALRRGHVLLRLAERPIVHCDRGFGASILRSGARIAAGLPTQLSLIQIPYARFEDKLHLTSILHEVGHEALHRLQLVRQLPHLAHRWAREEGASPALARAFGRWMREMGPDVWAFLASGLAAVCTTTEILSLPPTQVFAVLPFDPHPPPWLRVQFGYELCQHLWGSGPWTDWAAEWKALYPLREAGAHRALLEQGVRLLRPLAAQLLEHRFSELADQPLMSLFDVSEVNPFETASLARRALQSGKLSCGRRSVCSHFAVFRALRLEGASLKSVNQWMDQWLLVLAKSNRWDENRRDFDKESAHAVDA